MDNQQNNKIGYLNTYLALCLSLALANRLLVLLLVHIWSVSIGKNGFLPIVMGGDDGPYYYNTAIELAHGSYVPVVVNVYPAIIGTIMRYTGITDIFWYKLMATLAGSATLLLGYHLLRAMRQQNFQWNAKSLAPSLAILFLLIGFYPSAVWNTSASLYRDGWIYMLHLLCVYLIFRLAHNRSLGLKVFFSAISIFALATLLAFRWYAALSVIIGIIVWQFQIVGNKLRLFKNPFVIFMMLIVFIGCIFCFARISAFLPDTTHYEKMLTYRNSQDAGSNIGIDLQHASTPLILPLFTYSLISNVLGPLPWQVHSGGTIAVLIGEVPILLCLCYGLIKRRRYIDSSAWFLIWQSLCWFFLIAFFNDNLGTATRLRVPAWNCLFILYAYLLYKSSADKKTYQDSLN